MQLNSHVYVYLIHKAKLDLEAMVKLGVTRGQGLSRDKAGHGDHVTKKMTVSIAGETWQAASLYSRMPRPDANARFAGLGSASRKAQEMREKARRANAGA